MIHYPNYPSRANVSDGELSLHTPLCLDVVTSSIVLLVHGGACCVFSLFSEVEKKRRHTLNKHIYCPFHAVKKGHCMFKRKKELMFWCSLVGADRPPKQAMSVVRQNDLGLCVLWPLSLPPQPVPRCKKVALYRGMF